eukprot:GHVQ01015740.1.p1 GENE.GHVQ01015740.1~~GHVQ01015740.1.p1  ORF type:complete len:151 (-),score=20.37 GHVQ01015740.1:1253-1705(-)
MVLIVLYMKADLEAVGKIEMLLNRTTWCFDVKQSNSEEKREAVTFTAGAGLEIPNSRGTADFMVRWEGSKHYSTISVTEVKHLTRPYTAEDTGNFAPVMGFECRGAEPCRWLPGNTGFRVTSEGGTVFEDVDLSEDWCDYDEVIRYYDHS